MKSKARTVRDEMRPEYDFVYSTAVRGKYHRRFLEGGTNVVILDPHLAKAFRTSEAVNAALRSLLEVTEATRRLTSRSAGRKRGRRAAGAR